eukprot:8636023-Lingulodinium_polyedra.AAC.1
MQAITHDDDARGRSRTPGPATVYAGSTTSAMSATHSLAALSPNSQAAYIQGMRDANSGNSRNSRSMSPAASRASAEASTPLGHGTSGGSDDSERRRLRAELQAAQIRNQVLRELVAASGQTAQ